MEKNFWQKIKGSKGCPIMATAPMSGVSDEAFRLMFLKYGKPDVFWTEFVPVDGFCTKGKEHCLRVLTFDKKEHPIVAQIFGSNPAQFEAAAKIIVKLGFDGIDINMGCPDREVEKQGAGASLINKPELAKEIIRAAKKGAGKIPVSVKTRIGYSKNQINEWLSAILEENVAALAVHFRTRNEQYGSPANWNLAKEIIKLRDKISPKTLILGNGDVKSLEQAKKLAKENGLDGVMIGRAVVGDPWFFSGREPDVKERLSAVVEHAEIFEKLNKNIGRDGYCKGFDSIKKHFHAYTKGFRGAKELREILMKVRSAKETKQAIKNFLNQV